MDELGGEGGGWGTVEIRIVLSAREANGSAL